MAETNAQEIDCGFQWDDNSQLYYHASSGFYHDPQEGWYYSGSDGLYYRFEDGNYVLLESNQTEEDQTDKNNTNSLEETYEAQLEGLEASIKASLGEQTDSSASNSEDQSDYPPPPSEWLEDTLIEMYLSGYTNRTTHDAASDMTISMETNVAGDDDIEELEEGEWVPDDPEFWNNFSEKILGEGVSEEEENWRAQFGQVSSKPDEGWMSNLKMVDLWDWGLANGTKKDGITEVARLIGRLTKRSTKLHPSLPSGGGRVLKSAPVCEVHLDIVRVTSGRIYRLRTPSLKYLASLSVFDASNPTKDWGFPQLSVQNHTLKSLEQSGSQNMEAIGVGKDKSLSFVKLDPSKKDHVYYRDRAAERRALHGGFGVGPGQKNSINGSDFVPSSPTLQPEEAAAESLNISFGKGSYARKILEGMGWKEGDALGSSMKGSTEPLQASGNKGTSGLGFDDGRRNYFPKRG